MFLLMHDPHSCRSTENWCREFDPCDGFKECLAAPFVDWWYGAERMFKKLFTSRNFLNSCEGNWVLLSLTSCSGQPTRLNISKSLLSGFSIVVSRMMNTSDHLRWELTITDIILSSNGPAQSIWTWPCFFFAITNNEEGLAVVCNGFSGKTYIPSWFLWAACQVPATKNSSLQALSYEPCRSGLHKAAVAPSLWTWLE